jgi:hypothetical protein
MFSTTKKQIENVSELLSSVVYKNEKLFSSDKEKQPIAYIYVPEGKSFSSGYKTGGGLAKVDGISTSDLLGVEVKISNEDFSYSIEDVLDQNKLKKQFKGKLAVLIETEQSDKRNSNRLEMQRWHSHMMETDSEYKTEELRRQWEVFH